MLNQKPEKKRLLLAAAVAITVPILFFAVRSGSLSRKNTSAPVTETSGKQTEQLPVARNQDSQSPTRTTPSGDQVRTMESTPSTVLSKSGTTLIPSAITGAQNASGNKAVTPSVTSPQSAAPVVATGKSNSDSKPKTEAPVAVVKAPEPEGCVTLTFRHKKVAGHTDEEACSQHKNLIRLKHANPTSVCVRVNKTPVPFELVKGKTGEILIGAVAGPKAEITARYCLGKSRCDEDCTIPKDEFMDSIGASDSAKITQVSQWEDKEARHTNVNAHIDSEMRKELDRLDAAESELFVDWIGGAEIPACGMKQAMN